MRRIHRPGDKISRTGRVVLVTARLHSALKKESKRTGDSIGVILERCWDTLVEQEGYVNGLK
jgi:hypothetical protein